LFGSLFLCRSLLSIFFLCASLLFLLLFILSLPLGLLSQALLFLCHSVPLGLLLFKAYTFGFGGGFLLDSKALCFCFLYLKSLPFGFL
jgi:hypothetical protein